MRIQVFSDLHTEFHRDFGRCFLDSLDPRDTDVLVVAGDLGVKDTLPFALTTLCSKFPHVVFVTGNHELYHSSPTAVETLRQTLLKKLSNLHWLDESVAIIDGQRFLGTTLWFCRSAETDRLQGHLNDFEYIQDFVPWVYEKNEQGRLFLEREVKRGDIVVTHHAPSPKSTHPKYVGSPLNVYFTCDVEGILWHQHPRLWIHGHMHDSCNYHMGSSQVVCNPFGYAAREENHKFQERLIFEV